VLEGAIGQDVRLDVPPETYWQMNAPKPGYANNLLLSDGGQLNGQSILGLALLNCYFAIFDRSVEKGLGVIKFAPIKR
jgi:hypothetical protein